MLVKSLVHQLAFVDLTTLDIAENTGLGTGFCGSQNIFYIGESNGLGNGLTLKTGFGFFQKYADKINGF